MLILLRIKLHFKEVSTVNLQETNTAAVKVTITKITDNSFPIFVEAEFTDFYGETHCFSDKLPIFSLEHNPKLPCEGVIRCIVIQDNGETCLIDTSLPDGVWSTQGLFSFEVLKTQLIFSL